MGAVCSCCAGKAKGNAARKKSSQRAAEDLRRVAAMRAPQTKKSKGSNGSAPVSREGSGAPLQDLPSPEDEKRTKKEMLLKRNTELLKLYGHTRQTQSSTLLQLSTSPGDDDDKNPPSGQSATAAPQHTAGSGGLNSSPNPSSKLHRANTCGVPGERVTSSSPTRRLGSQRRSQLKRASPCASLVHISTDKASTSNLAEELGEDNTADGAEAEDKCVLTELEQFAFEFKKMPQKKPPAEEPAPGRSDSNGTILSGDSDGNSDRSLGEVTPLYGPGQVVEPNLINSPTFGEMDLCLSGRGSKSNAMVLLEIRSACNLVYRSAPDERPSIYVKAYLQSDDGKKVIKRKTKNLPGRDNVKFDEILMFRSQGLDKIMKVMIWEDHGVLGRNCMLGEIIVDLAVVDLRAAASGWYPLFPPYSSVSGQMSPVGSMMSLNSSMSNDTASSVRSPLRLIPSSSQKKKRKAGKAFSHGLGE